jgi:Leucine-rich repeat (LRR) protein
MGTFYDLAKALKNPKTPKDLVIFLNREESHLFDQLDKFTNLRELSLLDGEDLIQLPPSILKLTQLKSLRLRGTGIRQLPEGIRALVNLTKLEIERTPLESLPESIGKLTQLVELDTRSTELQSLPESIGKLKKLQLLYLKNNCIRKLPETIGQLKALKRFDLTTKKLVDIPDSIGELQQLEVFCLNNTQIKQLPNSFSKLTNLRFLNLNDNQLKFVPQGISLFSQLLTLKLDDNNIEEFPVEVCDCPLLERLTIKGNKLKELPEELAKLRKLDRLDLMDNRFQSLPYVLLDWGDTFALNHRWGFSIDSTLFHNAKIFDLLNKKAFKVLSRSDKVHYFKLFSKDKIQISNLSQMTVRKAINAKVTAVADSALEYLTQKSASTIQLGSEVLILGKIAGEKNKLISQIEACGLQYTTKLKDSTTHVLVSSRSNKKLDKLPDTIHWNWITEVQLMYYIDKIQPSFLMQSASADSIQQVVSLIMTLDEENMALALELITGGGLPQGLLTEVFIVYKLSEVAATRKKAQILLKQKAPIELQEVLRRRTNIRQNKSYYFDEDYRALSQKLDSYTETTAIDLGKLAFAVAIKSRLGYALALDNAPEHLRRRLLDEVLIKDGDTFALPYHEHLRKFPPELVEYTQLKKINIDTRHYWDRNGQWVPNKLFVIPDQITELQELRELQVWPATLHELPVEALCKLKNLQKVLLRISENIDISSLKEALPNCEIDIRKE